MRRQPLQWREARHHHDLQISYVRLPRDAIERDQNQVKNHQSQQQKPWILFSPVFGPVSQRHESSGSGRRGDGETERRRDGETERQEGSFSLVSPSLCPSVSLSLCLSVPIPHSPSRWQRR